MPTRMIRESILDSARYLECTESEQLLFIHLILLADDFGCVSLAPAFLSRRAFSERPGYARLIRMLSGLADADLIRIYEVGGARFGFIPRFGQRLRQKRLRHPIPPGATLEGDEEAKLAFIEFKHLDRNLTVTCQQSAVTCPPEVEVKRSKSKAVDRSEGIQAHPLAFISKGREPEKPGINPVEGQRPDPTDALTLKAEQAGLTQRDNETRGQFALRVAQAPDSQDKAPAKGKFED